MTDSWKKGALVGLIAGIIATIIEIIFFNIAINIGITTPENILGAFSWEMHLQRILIINSVWGIIFGVLFAVFYDRIPKRGYMKGLVFGLILWLIGMVRPMSFMAAYGWSYVVGFLFIYFFVLSFYGLLLGILFKKEVPLESIRYNIGNGVKAGIIAGLIGGTAVVVMGILSQWVLNLWVWIPGPFSLTVLTSAAINHITINAIWGSLQGLIFAMFYDRIPGKHISKGLIYGGLLCLLVVLYSSSYSFGPNYVWPFNAVMMSFGFLHAIVFGIVIGYLYRKPAETPSTEKEEIQVVKIVKCIHCSASIAKGSEYCNKCGKKQ